jgi:hypothetical protein
VLVYRVDWRGDWRLEQTARDARTTPRLGSDTADVTSASETLAARTYASPSSPPAPAPQEEDDG